MASDYQIGEALLIGVVRHQVMTVATEGNAVTLPEVPAISNSYDQKLVEQLAETIRVIGDKLDQDTEFNDAFDGLVKVCDKNSFWKIVEKVFKDDQINWGRIVVLFYAVGKLAAKMVMARLPCIVSDILALSLDYFKRYLLDWICKMGGWVKSIPALAQFAIEQFSRTSPKNYSFVFGAVLTFTSGALLGAFIFWRLHKSS
ncbi:apoptosis regulator BAX-like [Misgurnus anguillicaudatus]|uniref:apoptosis regulator BAX-like n=1 Tax=Misgurnus anguillicaudatus TaxID=75329 RepID=UPI00243601CC|nr:apoptosis regulator BAX-like isoform X3 [Misgurnus anguillicaudatus]